MTMIVDDSELKDARTVKIQRRSDHKWIAFLKRGGITVEIIGAFESIEDLEDHIKRLYDAYHQAFKKSAEGFERE